MKRIIRKLKSMPEMLAMVACGLIILGPLVIITVLVPVDDHHLQEGSITYAELWSSGQGYLLLIAGITMIVISISIFRRAKWVRYFFPVFFFSMIPYSLIEAEGDMHFQWISAVVSVLITLWYFFRKRNVIEYFKPDPITVAEQDSAHQPATR
jgi:hypothetical protein